MARERDSKKHRSKRADVPQLTSDDFFLRATEFRVWLAQTKDKYVEDLSTDEAAALFRRKFVKKWNRGQLARMFYDGIPERVLEQTRRTKHTWGFAQRLSDREAMELASARDSVGVATRKSDLLAPPRAPQPQSRSAVATEPENNNSSSSSHRRTRERDASEDRDRSRHKRKSHRSRDASSSDDDADRRRRSHTSDRKRRRKHHESHVLEELAPKETGREAMLEKRRQVAGKLHGAARDREENRDGLDVSEDFLMGGGGDDLQRRLKSREQVRDRRQQEAQDKLDDFKAKEAARMDKFLQDMGISATSKPITIAPRKN